MPKPAVLWLALFAASCVVDRQVLDQAPESGGSNPGGTLGGGTRNGEGGTAEPPSPPLGGKDNPPGFGGSAMFGGAGSAGMSPVFWADCLGALRGQDGDECDPGAFPCQFQQGCKLRYAACIGMSGPRPPRFELVLGDDDSQCGTLCVKDGECDTGNWCVAGKCQPCNKEEVCPPSWELVERNGCTMCAPQRQCKGHTDCGLDETCVAGEVCLPGCSDPSCCYGNLCVNNACPPPKGLDCFVVGCAGESHCIVSAPAKCSCGASDYSWQCDPPVSSNFCK